MKKIFLYSVAMLASASMFSSCIGDLDTEPLAQTVVTADVAFAEPESYDQYVNYVYGYFSMVSQGDPGNSDIAVSDAGQSEYSRQYMVLNELSTDALNCIWGDDYIDGIQYNSWIPENNAIKAVYLRGTKAVALCNQFLRSEVSGDDAVKGRGHGDRLDDIHAYRSELRVLRAWHNYVLMDLFGNPPVVKPENVGSANYPKQMGRKALFEYIEQELLELVEDEYLPATPVAYPRVSKGTAWAILARMYLNAEVYTGEARWEEAKNAAEQVITAGGYQLHDTYAELFMQDNTTNGAQNEFILAAMYDAVSTPSWGGTTTLINAAVNDPMRLPVSKYFGFSSDIYMNQWNGYIVSDDFVMKNFELQGVDRSQGCGYDRAATDQRALFFATTDTHLDGFNPEWSDFSGWSCIKWVPLDSNGRAACIEVNIENSSADFAFIRLAEMYLISAEAEARLSGGTLTASSNGYNRIKALRERANGVGCYMPVSFDLDEILKERVRELMWEGHRRTDLIRYGYFLSSNYPWPYKAGQADGRKAIDEHRAIYPLLQADLIANKGLVQNPGY